MTISNRSDGKVHAPNMTRYLDDDEVSGTLIESISSNDAKQSREVTVISESGLYHTVINRKHVGYSMGQELLNGLERAEVKAEVETLAAKLTELMDRTVIILECRIFDVYNNFVTNKQKIFTNVNKILDKYLYGCYNDINLSEGLRRKEGHENRERY